jgi:hypothetical protein
MILPPLHARFGCASVLDKKEATAGFEHAAHLRKRTPHIEDAAQCPCGHDGVEASVLDWNFLCRGFESLERCRGSPCCLTGHLQELRRRVESENLSCAFAVERQIETRTDADFKHPTGGGRNEPAAIGHEPALPHRQVDQPREDTFLIKAHRSMIMHAMPARWRSGLVTAKRGIGGDLCGRKQRALCDVRRKMGRPELPLKGCYRLNLKAKLVRLDPALRKRLVKSPFCLNDLGAKRLRLAAHGGHESFCRRALRIGEIELTCQFEHVERAGIGIELGRFGQNPCRGLP